MARRPLSGHKRTRAMDSRATLANELRAGRMRPVYVLEGDDLLRIEQMAVSIRKRAILPGSEVFSDHVLDAETAGWAGILRQVFSTTLFGGRQAVWARHCDRLKSTEKDVAESALAKYLRAPNSDTVLILSGEHFDARRSWVKIARDLGYLVQFHPPKGPELHAWILKTANNLGFTCNDEVASLLADLVGPDLTVLHAEIEKLALLERSQGKAIDAACLPGYVLEQHELEAFSLTDTVAPGNTAKMLKNFVNQTSQGRSPEELAPLLIAHLRRAVMVAAFLQENEHPVELPGLTGINPWILKNKLLPLSRQLHDRERKVLLSSCIHADLCLKSRPLPPGLVVERLLASVGFLCESF